MGVDDESAPSTPGRPCPPADEGHLAALRVARLAHPAIVLSAEGFAHYLGERRRDPATGQPHEADLYLCFGCLERDPRALATFETLFTTAVEPARRRLGLPYHEREEVKQALRERLLVGTDGRARLGDYLGRGSLSGWLRAAAVRAGLNVHRQQARSTTADDEDAWLSSPSPTDDPEVAALKRSSGDAFRTAFREAIGSLPARDRLLLRQHLLDGLSHEQLGALHQVHPVTAYRWLRSARDEVMAETRRRLGAALRLRPREVDSMLRLLESRFEASASTILTTA